MKPGHVGSVFLLALAAIGMTGCRPTSPDGVALWPNLPAVAVQARPPAELGDYFAIGRDGVPWLVLRRYTVPGSTRPIEHEGWIADTEEEFFDLVRAIPSGSRLSTAARLGHNPFLDKLRGICKEREIKLSVSLR